MWYSCRVPIRRACPRGMPVSKLCFYWLWDGPLFISVVTAKQSAEIGSVFPLYAQNSPLSLLKSKSIYLVSYWDRLMAGEANWSREICKNYWFFGYWKNRGGHFDSQLGHVNSSARGADCFMATKLQCGCAETSQWDQWAWPRNKTAGMGSHRRLKNILGSELLMKPGFYLKSGINLHCDIIHS